MHMTCGQCRNDKARCSARTTGKLPCDRCKKYGTKCTIPPDIRPVSKKYKATDGTIQSVWDSDLVRVRCVHGESIAFRSTGVMSTRVIKGVVFTFCTANHNIHKQILTVGSEIPVGVYTIDNVTLEVLDKLEDASTLGAVMSSISSSMSGALTAVGKVVGDFLENEMDVMFHNWKMRVLKTIFGGRRFDEEKYLQHMVDHIPEDKIGIIIDAVRPHNERILYTTKAADDLVQGGAFIVSQEFMAELRKRSTAATSYRCDPFFLKGPFPLFCTHNSSTYQCHNINFFGAFHEENIPLEDRQSYRTAAIWCDACKGPFVDVRSLEYVKQSLLNEVGCRLVKSLDGWERALEEFVGSVPHMGKFTVLDMLAPHTDPTRGVLQSMNAPSWHLDKVYPTISFHQSDQGPHKIMMDILLGTLDLSRGWSAPDIRNDRQDGSKDYFILSGVIMYMPRPGTFFYEAKAKVLLISHKSVMYSTRKEFPGTPV